MRFKPAALACSLSLLALLPAISHADTLTLTGVGGASTDGIYVYPYDFTVTGPGGTSTDVAMSCLNFNREIVVGETWTVDPVQVSSITGTVDGETEASFRADAWLLNQYGTTAATNSEIQFAIWSIMDPTDVNSSNANYDGPNAFDATAQALASQAKSQAAILPTSYYANDVAFIPSASNTSGWYNGDEPQIFLVDPAPAALAPEPSSLLLFGTGLIGSVALVRRRTALAASSRC